MIAAGRDATTHRAASPPRLRPTAGALVARACRSARGGGTAAGVGCRAHRLAHAPCRQRGAHRALGTGDARRLRDHALRRGRRAPEPARGAPAHRRRGVARRLVQLARGDGAHRRHFRHRGWSCAPATRARAPSTARSATARSGEIPGYYQGVEAALRMKRDVRGGARAASRPQLGLESVKSNS